MQETDFKRVGIFITFLYVEDFINKFLKYILIVGKAEKLNELKICS